MRRAAALLLCAILAAPPALQAQPVYRCGPDGREYRQAPCPEGRAVEVADPRTGQQRQDAEQAARRDALLGERLRRERETEQARAERQARSDAARAPNRQRRDDASPRPRQGTAARAGDDTRRRARALPADGSGKPARKPSASAAR